MVWHIHQPLFIPNDEVLRQIHESYRIIIQTHKSLAIPLTLNITGALLERFASLDPKIINDINELVQNNLLELTGTGYYHPMLPLLSESDAVAHIKKDKQLKKRIFSRAQLSGFWPTDLGWAPWLVPLLNEQKFQWVIVDSTSLTQATALPEWQEIRVGGHTVLSPQIESITFDDEVSTPYEMLLSDKKIIILVRNRDLSLTLSDHNKGIIYQEHLAEQFADEVAQKTTKNGILILAEDGERINTQTARGYQRILTALQKTSTITFSTPSKYLQKKPQLQHKYFPASTFQYDMAAWTQTMDDQAYLLYLNRAETTIRTLELSLGNNNNKKARAQLSKARESLLKAQDSGALFWKFHQRTRSPSWQYARDALHHAESGFSLMAKS